MLKIAISGNIASGKSTVEKILADMGYMVYDTDEIAHEILEKTDEVKQTFKEYDIFSDGKIDRKKLGKIVFNDKEKLRQIEAIIHPKVKIELENIFKRNQEIAFVSVPQLFEAGFNIMFDKIIYITADREIRIQRLKQRNGYTESEAILRINAQTEDNKKMERADFIITNNSDLNNLKTQVVKIINIIKLN